MRAVAALALSLAVLIGGCADRRPRALGDRPLLANPSAVVATEIAFARAAQERGQWTAFRQFADDDAEMFVPQRVRAKDWLGGRADPPKAVSWQPHRVFMSCDGGAAATTGAWQRPDGSQGYFTTIWLRQRDGEWEWILDHGDALTAPRAAPDAIATRTASCVAAPEPPPMPGDDARTGRAGDRSLAWTSAVRSDGSRRIVVRLWNGSAYENVVDDAVAAPGGSTATGSVQQEQRR